MLDDEDVEIVLRRSELKMIVDAIVAKRDDDPLRSNNIVLQSCAYGNRLSPKRTAISISVEKEIGDEVIQGAVCRVVKDAMVQMVTKLEVLSMIAFGLTKSNESIPPNVKFVEKW